MSEAKFTKKMEVGITTDDSPFCIDGFCNVDGERFEVFSVWGVNDDTVACAQSKANAHLIAAAPEMYEMLIKISEAVNSVLYEIELADAITELGGDIEKLLAKARGESQ